MFEISDLYNLLPIGCKSPKTKDKLYRKYVKFFTYIMDSGNSMLINELSSEQLHSKYINFMDITTINRELVSKLCDVDEWIKIYPTESEITKAFSILDVGCSGCSFDIKEYTKCLIDMIIKYRVINLTMLEKYYEKNLGDNFYKNLSDISMKPTIPEKTLWNGSMDCDGQCDVEVTIYYDIIDNSYIRKDSLCWSDITYDMQVPEYYNIDSIKDTIIPCYECRMGICVYHPK